MLCEDCAEEHVKENARQLRMKSGPYYEKWRQAMFANL